MPANEHLPGFIDPSRIFDTVSDNNKFLNNLYIIFKREPSLDAISKVLVLLEINFFFTRSFTKSLINFILVAESEVFQT